MDVRESASMFMSSSTHSWLQPSSSDAHMIPSGQHSFRHVPSLIQGVQEEEAAIKLGFSLLFKPTSISGPSQQAVVSISP